MSQGYRIDMSGVYGSWLMFGIAAGIVFLAVGRWWGYIGHGLYLVLLGFIYWSAFSKSEYEIERRKCDTLDRRGYAKVMLLFFAALPTAVWLIVMLPLLLAQLRLAGRH